MKILFNCLFIAAGLFLFTKTQAQNALVERFGEASIASIEGTEKLAILEFQNENGYVVQDLSGKKDVSQFPDALEVEPIHENTPPLTEEILDIGFELFAYKFPTSGNTNSYYRVGNSGKILIIYSLNAVKHQFEKQSEK